MMLMFVFFLSKDTLYLFLTLNMLNFLNGLAYIFGTIINTGGTACVCRLAWLYTGDKGMLYLVPVG
jgi:hypothetical protein